MKKQKRIDPTLTRKFLQSMRDKMHEENIKYKKLFIQLFVDKINLYSDHYEIMLTTANSTGGVSKFTEKLVLHELNAPSSQMKNGGTIE